MEIYPETDNTESINRTVAVAAVKTSRVHLTAPYTDRQPRTTASREVFSVRKIGGCLICMMHMTFGPMGMFQAACDHHVHWNRALCSVLLLLQRLMGPP